MKELKPWMTSGYLYVGLWKENTLIKKRVHRLVAEAFIDNPDNKPQVNHRDEDKTNNCVENLEWCTAEYNLNYGARNERAAKTLTNHKAFSIPVVLFGDWRCVSLGSRSLTSNGY